jgi:Polysaccharide lyase 14
MRVPGPKFLLFNAAAALAGVAAVIAAVWSVLIPATVDPCSERYHAMTQFGLERGGNVLTAADLQASLGGKDVGVIDSVTIEPVKGAPTPLAMSVRLQKASVSPQGIATPFVGGARFPWQPHVIQGKTSACLSYHVLLPADFDFARGGALPGIAGAEGSETGDGFVAQLAWRAAQGGGVTVRVTENGVTQAFPAERQTIELARGHWVKLEQEVVVNTPKMQDGILRVWVDGVLRVDRRDISYRNKPDVAITGVSVDVYRGTGPDDAQAAAGKAAKVQLTPLQVRWP